MESPVSASQPSIIEESNKNAERFVEIVKKARQHRYINGKLSRGTKMDSDGPEQNISGKSAEYGWSIQGDPSIKEGMMYANSIKYFPEKMAIAFEVAENREFCDTRFILKVPIKDSTDVMLVDVQIVKGPPEDPRHKTSLRQTTNKTLVRLAKDEAEELLDMYRKDPTLAEKFYKACFPALDSIAPEVDKHNGIIRVPQGHILIVEDITAKVDETADFNSRFSSGPEDTGVYRRWFDKVKLDTRNYMALQT